MKLLTRAGTSRALQRSLALSILPVYLCLATDAGNGKPDNDGYSFSCPRRLRDTSLDVLDVLRGEYGLRGERRDRLGNDRVLGLRPQLAELASAVRLARLYPSAERTPGTGKGALPSVLLHRVAGSEHCLLEYLTGIDLVGGSTRFATEHKEKAKDRPRQPSGPVGRLLETGRELLDAWLPAACQASATGTREGTVRHNWGRIVGMLSGDGRGLKPFERRALQELAFLLPQEFLLFPLPEEPRSRDDSAPANSAPDDGVDAGRLRPNLEGWRQTLSGGAASVASAVSGEDAETRITELLRVLDQQPKLSRGEWIAFAEAMRDRWDSVIGNEIREAVLVAFSNEHNLEKLKWLKPATYGAWDLRGVVMPASFAGIGCQFSQADLWQAVFDGCQLPSAQFIGTHPTSVTFIGANLRDAVFAGDERERQGARYCIFDGCDLSGSTWKWYTNTGSVFIDCNLSNASFRECSFRNVVFVGCNLQDVVFEDVTFSADTRVIACAIAGTNWDDTSPSDGLFVPREYPTHPVLGEPPSETEGSRFCELNLSALRTSKPRGREEKGYAEGLRLRAEGFGKLMVADWHGDLLRLAMTSPNYTANLLCLEELAWRNPRGAMGDLTKAMELPDRSLEAAGKLRPPAQASQALAFDGDMRRIREKALCAMNRVTAAYARSKRRAPYLREHARTQFYTHGVHGAVLWGWPSAYFTSLTRCLLLVAVLLVLRRVSLCWCGRACPVPPRHTDRPWLGVRSRQRFRAGSARRGRIRVSPRRLGERLQLELLLVLQPFAFDKPRLSGYFVKAIIAVALVGTFRLITGGS